jgi:hypothetical protein
MNLREHLISLIEIYAKAKGLSPSRVGHVLFSSGTKYRELTEGKDITLARFEAAIKFFDANWPDDVPWPEGLQRPSLVAAAASTEAA